MKLSKIAFASLLAVGSASSFAAADACVKTVDSHVTFVNTCPPEKILYVAGASALGNAIKDVIPTLFDVTTGTGGTGRPVITVIDGGSPNGVAVVNPTNNGAAGNGVSAWYGIEKVSGKSLFVVYNSYMGSAAGVSQVLAAPKKVGEIPESLVVTVGPVPSGKTTANNTCVDFPATAAKITVTGTTSTIAGAANTVVCTSKAVTVADLAISDVNVKELAALYTQAGVPKAKLNLYKSVPLAMQGFGVVVNKNFYTALQNAQIAAGSLPGCTAETVATLGTTAVCQPNITSAQYASLASVEGSIKSAAGFIPGDTTQLTLARRDDLSGTQASSNIFFLSNACNKLDIKSKVNTFGGALTPLSSLNKPATATGLTVVQGVQTADVESLLKASSGYTIGVMSLSRDLKNAYHFVKLDGASPNFDSAGLALLPTKTNSAKSNPDGMRVNMLTGQWPFQMTAYAVVPFASVASGAPKKDLIENMISGMSNAATADLSGIGYFNGTDTTQATLADRTARETLVSRVGGNNCSPLIVRNN